MRFDVITVDPAFPQHHVEHRVVEGDVGAGQEGEVEIGGFGGVGAAGVDDHQLHVRVGLPGVLDAAKGDRVREGGVAAGDESAVMEKGLWSKIFTSKTTQDNSIGQAEFNNHQNGFIVGFDAELKDENVFGVAVTRSDSKTNFFSSVDNSQKSDLYSVILYNETSLTDKLYLNTNFKYGKAYVHHKIHTAKPLSGKTTADIFSASVDSVYKHKSANGTLISPMLRLTFSNFFIDDFSEINDDIKVYIPHKRARVLLAQAGVGAKRAIALGESKLEIEFHGGIETILALRQSNDMITIISDVSEHIQGKFVHPTKTRYNFGANLAIVTEIGLRAGVAADHIFANRYRSSGAFLFLVYHF